MKRTPRGQFNRLVTVLAKTDGAKDAYGTPAATWTAVGRFWCKVQPQTSREYIAAKQVQAEVSHVLRADFLSTLTTYHRIQLGTRTLTVSGIMDIEDAHIEMDVACREAI